MDEQWLREWSADEVEYPPKRLREEVGELLAELDAARARVAALEPLADAAVAWFEDGEEFTNEHALMDAIRAERARRADR